MMKKLALFLMLLVLVSTTLIAGCTRAQQLPVIPTRTPVITLPALPSQINETVANLTEKTEGIMGNLTNKSEQKVANLTEKTEGIMANLTNKSEQKVANLTEKTEGIMGNLINKTEQKIANLTGKI
jgi:ElaB/YqjD/DUF883 family membrane-anchored ribosome-binding protein